MIVDLKPSKHFHPNEMVTRRDGLVYPKEWGDRWYVLAHLTADVIREERGRPLVITKNGGYGTRPTAGSAHPQGRAMDLCDPKGTALDLHALVLALYNAGKLPGLGGLGIYDTFVHIDTMKRSDGRLRRWDYRTKK